jgi:uncharacterized Zn finger protein
LASIADLVDDAALQDRAGKDAYAAGVTWADLGLVRYEEFGPLNVRASVATPDEPEVELSTNGETLGWTCTCEDGRAGRFCGHAVAVGIETRRRAAEGRS